MIPKTFILPILFCLTTITGCKKKSFLSGPDKVTVHQFDPIPEITSVDSTSVFPGAAGSYQIPYPSDSTASYLLDIDGDSDPDFTLIAKHWFEFLSASSPGANYIYTISIEGIESTSQIAVTGESPNHVLFFSAGESINPRAEWENNTSWLMHTGGSAYGSAQYNFSGTQYIGLRVKKKSRQHYCWLKLTTVPDKHKLNLQSFGFNKSNGNDIAAGQGE